MREDTALGKTWQKRFKGWHHLPLYLQLCILPFSSNLYVSFVLTGAGARAGGLISPSGGESELLSVHFLCGGGGGGAGAAWHESHAV